jgi:hypothetical protein
MQGSRYELKYLIDEDRAAGVRDFLRSYLVPDEFADPDTNSYPIHSLYLDSHDLALYRGTMDGLKNRFKLRIRFYDGDASHPAFLEIKRRDSDVIRKQRAAVTRQGAGQLLANYWPDASQLIDRRPKSVAGFHDFCMLSRAIRALGCVYVSYQREAYVSPDSNELRVTFDRGLRAGRYQVPDPIAPPASSERSPLNGVVLEIKFTDRFPRWMHDLILVFNLTRRPFAKYITCVQTMGEYQMRLALAGDGCPARICAPPGRGMCG